MSLTSDQLKLQLGVAERRCAARGVQLTSLRRLALELLLETDRPLKAYTLLEAIAGRGRRSTPATIYRTLDFLIELGLAHKVASINAFVACTDTDETHQPLLLVCPDCLKATEINDHALSAALFGRLDALGHSVGPGAVEVRGQCRDCADKASEL
ncbi:MAG: transcriptional repressor [Deltaproteobacteria bacterium]|jgi:Fur family zinc uptake transcriptional regulator|nr:transcriptional repressor [Deltaproteobacteria bacterium]